MFSLERILERLGATSFSFIRLSGTKHPAGWREAGQDKEALREFAGAHSCVMVAGCASANGQGGMNHLIYQTLPVFLF